MVSIQKRRQKEEEAQEAGKNEIINIILQLAMLQYNNATTSGTASSTRTYHVTADETLQILLVNSSTIIANQI